MSGRLSVCVEYVTVLPVISYCWKTGDSALWAWSGWRL